MEARPGDVVRIGACTLPGDILVPAGVTLEGVDSSTSSIDALPGNLVAITLDTQPDLVTVVRNLSVLGRGVAIDVQGSGGVLIEGVDIDVEAGHGVAADGVASAEFRGVTIRGPISPENAGDERWIEETESIGISLADVASVSMRDVVVDGMAWAGFVANDSNVNVEALSVRHTLGYGVLLFGGQSDFVDLEINDTYQGLRGEPSIALVARETAWTADGLQMHRSERYGVVAQAGSASIDSLDAQGGGDAAVWVGDASAFRLAESSITDTRFAAIVVVDSNDVTVQDITISNIATSVRNIGAAGLFATLELGDGLHLIGDLAGATFGNVNIQGSERAGIVLDLGVGAPPTFTDVSVEAPEGALGAVAGRTSDMPFELNVAPEDGWDEGIGRDASAATNDAMFNGALGIARAQTPAALPL